MIQDITTEELTDILDVSDIAVMADYLIDRAEQITRQTGTQHGIQFSLESLMPRVSDIQPTPDDGTPWLPAVHVSAGRPEFSDAERAKARRDIAHTVQVLAAVRAYTEGLIDEETFNRILAVQLEDADLVVPESVVPE